MPLIHLKATSLDRSVARGIARRTSPGIEKANKVLTRLASERVVYMGATAIWLVLLAGSERQRRSASHMLAAVAISALLQRALKKVVWRERPDREMVEEAPAKRHGIPYSGEANDAFPSGHAMNLGVLAPALSSLWPRWSKLIWGACLLIASTRVFILAHWVTDVVTGFATGVALDSLLRLVIPPHEPPGDDGSLGA